VLLCSRSAVQRLVGRLGSDSQSHKAMDSGSRITGGGSGYAVILAPRHAGGVLYRDAGYGTRLGDLKKSWFILFSN